MHIAPRIGSEADLIAAQLIDARQRLNRHGLALDWDIAGTEASRHKLDDLTKAFARLRSPGTQVRLQRITVGDKPLR